jgi:hypothetical protein
MDFAAACGVIRVGKPSVRFGRFGLRDSNKNAQTGFMRSDEGQRTKKPRRSNITIEQNPTGMQLRRS